MGRTFLFECPRCHYRATVAGGPDRGFHCFVKTVWCRDCAALYDVPTRLRVDESELRRACPWAQPGAPREVDPDKLLPLATLWYNRLLFRPMPKSRWVNLQTRCPRSRHHRIEPWSDPGKCPKCNTLMERMLMPYRIWE